MAAPSRACDQYGVMVPGASLARTERTKERALGTRSDGRRIFDISVVCARRYRLRNKGTMRYGTGLTF